MTFFADLSNENTSGVAYKNITLKKAILAYFSKNGNSTIAELCGELALSAPKINSILNEMIAEGLVRDYGKLQSKGGRKPNIYGLVMESAYFLGVDVKNDHVNIGLTDLQKNLIHVKSYIPYHLHNSKESLDELCKIINHFIKEGPVKREKILGAGLNLSGRINYKTGYSYSFFHFNEEPLSRVIGKNIGLPIFLENDSRAMAFGEFSAGVVHEEENVLFLNIDYGIGVGIMINSQVYYGKSGFAGEFGHIPFFDNEIICNCGKKGCLETEVSGWALVRKFKEKLTEGSTSILSSTPADKIKLGDIINAAINDDVLAIELVAEVGEKLGRGIAVLINMFNPEMVILGGSLAKTGEYISLPVKSALNKYSLTLVNNDTQLKMSKLGEEAGVIGACLLVRNRLLGLA
jgi:predicted NBD/HSP70 family sugar kinase